MNQKRSILYTLPDFDLPTRVGSNWFEETVKKAKANGFEIYCLRGNDDTKENLEKLLSNQPKGFLTGIGHGNKTTYTGQNKEPMIVEGRNEGIVTGPWYGLSCLIGASLGKAVVDANCPAFCGYEKEFVFTADRSEPDGGRPAQGFKEANNAIVLDLIDGGDYDSAYKKSQAKFQEWIEKGRKEGNKDRVKWLLWDKHHMVAPATSNEYGDGGTMIEKPTKRYKVDLYLEKKEYVYDVYGHVYEAKQDEESPIENATVILSDVGKKKTNKEGYFKFEGVEPGTYTIEAHHPDYKPEKKEIELK